MTEPRLVTLLHISDMQFGRNHLFGRLKLPPPDSRFDSLAERLTQDLQDLRRDFGLKPDLLVASGDLAEWGLPQEFNAMRTFLDHLVTILELSRERVILVPGNHDINRKLCEGYFAIAFFI
jgi:3',5'-cyclic AMP phosphodiesterase CpdA